MIDLKEEKKEPKLEYNTRGQKHSHHRKEGDLMFNKGFVWDNRFDYIVKKSIESYSKLRISNHIQEFDKTGNRTMNPDKEITMAALKNAEVVEIETKTEFRKNKEYQVIFKAVCRLPVREDGHQVVTVIACDNPNFIRVRTALLNEATDNHQINLDTREFDTNTNHFFAYYAYKPHKVLKYIKP